MDDAEDTVIAGLLKPVASRFLLIAPADRKIWSSFDGLPHNRSVSQDRTNYPIALRAQSIEQPLEIGFGENAAPISGRHHGADPFCLSPKEPTIRSASHRKSSFTLLQDTNHRLEASTLLRAP